MLERLGASLKDKAVLFPCEDEIVLLLSSHRDRLVDDFHVVLPRPEIVELMTDKVSFYPFAEREGISIPRTHVLHTREDAEAAARRLRFPCVLKPGRRTPEWLRATYVKAFKANEPQELVSLFDQYRQVSSPLLAQEWIPGDDRDHYSCNCYYDADSRPVVTFATRKLRQWPPRLGQGCLSEETRDAEVVRSALRLFDAVPFVGLGYVELKRDVRSGELVLIEPNIGRPTGRSASCEAGGVELLFTMYCDALGWSLPANLQQRYSDVRWIHFRHDVQSALHYWRRGELGITDWCRSWRGPKTDAIFSPADPMPFFADLLRVGRAALSPVERRKRRRAPLS